MKNIEMSLMGHRSFLILGDEFLFLNRFFIFRFFFFLLFYVILLLLIFTKTMLLLSFYLINFFFMKITFIFSCSGMFRHVPECSMFLVLSTPLGQETLLMTDFADLRFLEL